MIESWPEFGRGAQSFSQFQDFLLQLSGDLRFAQIGGTLIVRGTVPAYATKALIDSEAEMQGIPIWNCVRVVPGRDWLSDGSRATG
jgi:hypothetical protein